VGIRVLVLCVLCEGVGFDVWGFVFVEPGSRLILLVCARASLKIYDDQERLTTFREIRDGYEVVKQGTQYYMEFLNIHPFLEVIMIVLHSFQDLGHYLRS